MVFFKDTDITLKSLNELSALSNRAYVFDISPKLRGRIKVIIDKLTNGEAELCTTDLRFDEMYTFMNEQEAMALICSLVKVFQVPNSDIEVIHFPADVSRADVLRAAADRLDAGEEFNGTY